MELTIQTSSPYQILIRRGCLDQLGEQAGTLFRGGGRAMIITDSNVGPLYARRAADSLAKAGFVPDVFTFPAGEESKRLSTIERVYAAMAEQKMTRTDFIVALGGGVTGDMAGFAAATYLRGIGFIQIPTSLLAQIDSSVGGKTGVDLPQGKNLVGAFHQPRLVLIDPDTLATLPPRFFADGMAEAIKYGCIKSRPLFELIRDNDLSKEPKVLERMITECVDCKRRVVEDDEFDTGERMLLNFGHTLGHALEKHYAFGKLTHGEAVGIGMVKICRAGETLDLTKPGTAEEIAALLRQYRLPTEDDAPAESLAKAAAMDKKGMGGTLNLILLREIGHSFVHPIPKQELLPIIIKEKEEHA